MWGGKGKEIISRSETASEGKHINPTLTVVVIAIVIIFTIMG